MVPAGTALADAQRDAVRLARFIYARAGILNRLPQLTVKAVQCGRWSDKTGHVTLPLWLWEFPHRLEAYRVWYVAHELAHHLMQRPGHDLHFQTMLAMLAPDEWHWESTYKPRHYDRAVRALAMDQNGISSCTRSAVPTMASSIDHTSRASHDSQR